MSAQRHNQGCGRDMFSDWWELMWKCMPMDWFCPTSRESRLNVLERAKDMLEKRVAALDEEIQRLRNQQG